LQPSKYANPVLIAQWYNNYATFGPYPHCDVMLPDQPLMFKVACNPSSKYLKISFMAKHLDSASISIMPDMDAKNPKYYGLTDDYKGGLRFTEAESEDGLLSIDQHGSFVKIPLTRGGGDRKFRAKLRIDGKEFTISNRIDALSTESEISVYKIHELNERMKHDELIDRIVKSMATNFFGTVSYQKLEGRIDELRPDALNALQPLAIRDQMSIPRQIRITVGPDVGKQLDIIAANRGESIVNILKDKFVDLLFPSQPNKGSEPEPIDPEKKLEVDTQEKYERLFKNISDGLISKSAERLVQYEKLEENLMNNQDYDLGWCHIAVHCSFNPVPKIDGETETWGKVTAVNWDGAMSSDPNIYDRGTEIICDDKKRQVSKIVVGGLPGVYDLFLPGLKGELVVQLWFSPEAREIPEKAVFFNSTLNPFKITGPDVFLSLDPGALVEINRISPACESHFSIRRITGNNEHENGMSQPDDGDDGGKGIEVFIYPYKKPYNEHEEVMPQNVFARLCGKNIVLHTNHDEEKRKNAFKKRFSDDLVNNIYSAFDTEDEILGIECAGSNVFAVARDHWGKPLLDLFNAGNVSVKLKITEAGGDSYNHTLTPGAATNAQGNEADDAALFPHGLPRGKTEIEGQGVTIHVFGSAETPVEPDMLEKTIELQKMTEENRNGFTIPDGCRLVWAEEFVLSGLEKGLYRCMLTHNGNPAGCLANATDRQILVKDRFQREGEITVEPFTFSTLLTNNEYSVALAKCKDDICYLHFGRTFWDKMPLLSRQVEMYYSLGWIETEWFWSVRDKEWGKKDTAEVPLHPMYCRKRPFGLLFESQYGNLNELDQHFFQDALLINYDNTRKRHSFISNVPETKGNHDTIKTVFQVQKPGDRTEFGYPGKEITMNSFGNYKLLFCGLVFDIRNRKSIYDL
jgi:hypothetical protein